ncbi:type II toxin-antitoxin system VapC family toxin [Methyloglobulus sp.]|uniref:type II toxin-antitoxin system VapC family toxin n=1 Tax=Methyloglobulus sp. TaxID=2518622 RepID=UPI0032B8727D
MIVIADASVSIKWFFQASPEEQDAGQAVQLLRLVQSGEVTLVQPPHWLPEVVAVITRVRPDIADQAIDYLTAMEIPIQQDADILKTAARLSRQYSHHLFDTLYHALAIHLDAMFVTADENYYRKVETQGNIQLLKSWEL